ncbi:hypothetical protein E2320_004487, partial [Naja naja]
QTKAAALTPQRLGEAGTREGLAEALAGHRCRQPSGHAWLVEPRGKDGGNRSLQQVQEEEEEVEGEAAGLEGGEGGGAAATPPSSVEEGYLPEWRGGVEGEILDYREEDYHLFTYCRQILGRGWPNQRRGKREGKGGRGAPVPASPSSRASAALSFGDGVALAGGGSRGH